MEMQSKKKKMEELFLAIYFNDLEKVKEFKEHNPALYAEKEKFLLNEYINPKESWFLDEDIFFDLKNLSYINHILWFSREWIDEIKPLVERNKKGVEQMMAFWCEELGQQNFQPEIEYNQYFEFFYCDDPNEIESDPEVILDPMSYFLKKGFREIDLKLYNRIECFDFAEVKKLLEQGAKTDVDVYNDGDSSAYMRIDSEECYLVTCELIPQFRLFEEKGYNQEFDIISLFGDLIGLAAHTKMLHLLDAYEKENMG